MESDRILGRQFIKQAGGAAGVTARGSGPYYQLKLKTYNNRFMIIIWLKFLAQHVHERRKKKKTTRRKI